MKQSLVSALFLAAGCLGIDACRGGGGGLHGDTFYGNDFAFRMATPPAGWKLLSARRASVAYRDEAKAATVLVNGRCGLDGEDIPLSALTHHLFMRFTERQPAVEEIVPFDGREAMHTILLAKLDGVPMKFDAWVLKKDGCVFDFILMAPPDRFALTSSDFMRFVHGFSTLRGPEHGAKLVARSSGEPTLPSGGGAPASTRFLPPVRPARFRLYDNAVAVLEHFGHAGRMAFAALVAMWRTPFEVQSTLYQMHSLGVRSVGIASITSIFVGMVMAVQFAYGLQRFGGMDYTGRIIGMSFARESRRL